jgi:hypothetical protein
MPRATEHGSIARHRKGRKGRKVKAKERNERESMGNCGREALAKIG